MIEDYEARNAAQRESETDSFTPYRYAHLARHLGGASRILDVGCNTGRGGAVLRRAVPNAHLEGVELLAERAAGAADHYDRVTVGNLTDLAAPNQPFDALVMAEMIEHVPYRDLDDLLGVAASLLAPGGRVLLTTPNPHYLFLRWRGGSVLGNAHVSVHCPAALSELFEHRGFRVVRVEGTGRVSRVIGVHFPLRCYGSYLLVAERNRK